MLNAKKILLFIFFAHFSIISIHNIHLFGSYHKFLEHEETAAHINPVGKFVIETVKNSEFNEHFTDFLRFYTTLNSTTKGFAFFSPNLYSFSQDLHFYDQDGNELAFPLDGFESVPKTYTFSAHFVKFIINNKMKDEVLKSISNFYLNKYTDVEEVNLIVKSRTNDRLRAENKVEYDEFFTHKIVKK
ncbi:hypothetical protein [Sediminitomix flava]|uniref:Uncharacterized protein n=1 Tax=Sediminitomix flava TaxID=379075 RepID=A0A315Z5B9_SEDFL|nr:hypothetical protein [Sediminitomix flava]PWJ38015.1 hypothetical protein BC781_108150 [Sediminitomix flava]